MVALFSSGCDLEMLELALRDLTIDGITGSVKLLSQPDMSRFRVGPTFPGQENTFTVSLAAPGEGMPMVDMLTLTTKGIGKTTLFSIGSDGIRQLIEEKV